MPITHCKWTQLLDLMSDEIHNDSIDSNESADAPIILVVEDDELTRKAVSRRLQAEGYEIIAVPNAGDALIIAQRHPFHVLVLDLHLMDGDPFSGIHEGFAVLDWLHVQYGELPFRVIIHTSQTGPKVMSQAEASGAFAFCNKRRDMSNLVQCVADAIESLRVP